MDEGVSLMTFFGHAAGSGFDLSIDDINSYNPLPGHYPFMLANGCYSGDIHSEELTTSERYIITANKGMIGYLASVGLGVPKFALTTYIIIESNKGFVFVKSKYTSLFVIL